MKVCHVRVVIFIIVVNDDFLNLDMCSFQGIMRHLIGSLQVCEVRFVL